MPVADHTVQQYDRLRTFCRWEACSVLVVYVVIKKVSTSRPIFILQRRWRADLGLRCAGLTCWLAMLTTSRSLTFCRTATAKLLMSVSSTCSSLLRRGFWALWVSDSSSLEKVTLPGYADAGLAKACWWKVRAASRRQQLWTSDFVDVDSFCIMNHHRHAGKELLVLVRWKQTWWPDYLMCQ